MKNKTKLIAIRTFGVFGVLMIVLLIILITPYWADEIIKPLSKQGQVGGMFFYTFLFLMVFFKLNCWGKTLSGMIFDPKRFIRK